MYLSDEDKEKLEYETVSKDAKLYLTRLLDKRIDEGRVHNVNKLVNRSRTLVGLRPYVLRSDGYGSYQAAEYTSHEGKMEIAFLRLGTIEFVEYTCELIEGDWFSIEEANEILREDGVSFYLEKNRRDIEVRVNPIEDIDGEEDSGHPNVRKLVSRMEESLESGDYAAVLHSSASVFETMAKEVIGIESVQDETLGSFFQRYRNDSALPDEILDYIEDIYDARNVTPLAGHGSLDDPDIDETQATALVKMTKAFVEIEYKLFQRSLSIGNDDG